MRRVLLVSHAYVAVCIENAFICENMIRNYQVRNLRRIERLAVLSSENNSGQQQSATNKSDQCFHSFSKGGTLILRQRVWPRQMGNMTSLTETLTLPLSEGEGSAHI